MNNKELLDALHKVQHELQVAEMAVNLVRGKMAAITSQLQENLRTGGQLLTPESPPSSNAPAGETAYPMVAPATQALRPTLPSLDFSEAVVQGVPQSPASRIAPQAAPTPTPAPVSPRQPNSLGPKSSGPTPEEEPRVQVNMESKRVEQLQHFFGTGSLFARYLSSEVIEAGKGMIRPRQPGSIKQYKEDLQAAAPNSLAEWPTGFYRNAGTSALQFLLQTDKYLVFLPVLSQDSSAVVLVAEKPLLPSSDWQPVGAMALMDILFVKQHVESELQKLTAAIAV